MLRYALIFLVIAIIAFLLGFTSIGATAQYIAGVLFVIFLILLVVSFITGKKVV